MWSRQASTSAPVIATSINYSSVAAPTPTSRPSVASNPAIVIPFLPSSTTTSSPSSTFLSTSALSSILSSQKTTTSSTPSYSLSSTTSPTSSAQNTAPQLSIKLIYLIPGFGLMGILLGGLIGWLVYRCMLRKPLMPRDDGALLIGPRYIGIQEPERHHIQGQNTEQKGQPTQMKNHVPGAIPAGLHFRWPSFNEKPAFHPDRGFHVPDEYLHDDDPLLALPLTLTTRPSTNVNKRTKSTRTTRTSKSARTFKSKRPTLRVAGPSLNDLSSPNSDNTSLALLELYESDEEEETRRKASEVPWESLRHKSIKRGILEQIKEEGKWLDSIRGLAGSSRLGPRPETIMEVDNALLCGRDTDDSVSPRKRPVTKTRRTDSTTATFPAAVESHGIGFQIIPESAATSPNQSPRRQGRKQNNRSNAPAKRTSNNGVDISQVPRRDVLPQSPAQLMSPPLQSQICFTPIPASSSRVESPNSKKRDYYSNSRVPSLTKPLVVLSPSKSRRKVQGDTKLEDPMKKVERIMASSWSARDLGQGGMRSLSPTGFGRHL